MQPSRPSHRSSSQRALRWIPGTLALAVLAACGGGDGDDGPSAPADPMASFRQQTIQWQRCNPAVLQSAQGNPLLANNRTQCADIRAPRDYNDPSRGEISLGLLRVAAGQPQNRRGALMFNPGGPGIDGLAFPVHVGGLWHIGNTASESGRLMRQLSDEYDLIGFSPRGVGASTKMNCRTQETRRPVDNSTSSQTPENIDNILFNAQKRAEACLADPLVPYITTEHVAHDMELIRTLMREEKLNYVGYSYGTRLGAWYGALYPQRVGRMVLDSNVDFSSNTYDLMAQPQAFQRIMDDVVAPYAARHPGTFGLGSDESAIRAIVPSLSPPVQTILQRVMIQAFYESGEPTDLSLVILAGSRQYDAIVRARPGATNQTIRTAITTHVFAPGNFQRNALLRESALQIHQAVIASNTQPSLTLQPLEATQVSIHCNDLAADTSIPNWIERRAQIAQNYPLGIGSHEENHPCLFWGGPRVTKPAIENLSNADVLLVQSQYDGATWAEGALKSFERMPSARMVYVTNEYKHAVFPYGSNCVDGTVAGYLLGTTPSARETRCEGLPLPADAGKSMLARTTASVPQYTDPELAKALQSRIRTALQPQTDIVVQ